MKKHSLLLLSGACLGAMLLSACQNGGNGNKMKVPTIQLARASSKLVSASFAEEERYALPLKTYHHKDFSDVAYLELSEFFYDLAHHATGTIPPSSKIIRLADGLFALECDGIITMILDTEEDKVTIKRSEYITASSFPLNHGVGMDQGSPKDTDTSCVHSSYKSRYLNAHKDEVYDLGEYHFDLVEQDQKIYAPMQLISLLTLKDFPSTIVYNGLDYYYSAYLSETYSQILMAPRGSFYATKGQFTFAGVLFTEAEPVGNEVHRFVYHRPDGQYNIFSFLPDGNAELRLASSPSEDGEAQEGSTTAYSYEDKDDGIYLSIFVEMMGAKTDMGTLKIPNEESYFGTKVRSQAVADFGYDLLRFQYDNIYGLRDDFFAKYNVKDTEAFAVAKNLKSGLTSTNSLTYDDAIADFLMNYVDDCHTTYSGATIYSGFERKASDIAREHTGARRTYLLGKREEYIAARAEALGTGTSAEEVMAAQGLYLEGKTAAIRFDSFAGSGVDRSNPVDTDPDNISMHFKSSTSDGFYSSFKEIEKHSEIENVVLDLTCNGGGAVNQIPYLTAFFSDDPILVERDTTTDVIRELHYSVDLNRNGIFGEDEDTYKDKYNFYILTSDFSFSCGNALPTIAHQLGVKIIGIQSGGGACAVGSYSDGSGTLFTTSCPHAISYQDETGIYIHNDAGIPVDHALAKDSWYDMEKLDAFVCGLSA